MFVLQNNLTYSALHDDIDYDIDDDDDDDEEEESSGYKGGKVVIDIMDKRNSKILPSVGTAEPRQNTVRTDTAEPAIKVISKRNSVVRRDGANDFRVAETVVVTDDNSIRMATKDGSNM